MFNRTVPIEQITNIFACNFGIKGWHPIVETLKEYQQNPQISFRDTTLYRYHKQFTPLNTSQALLEINDDFLPLFVYPWGAFTHKTPSNKSAQTSRFCGPSSDPFIEEEFQRIISLFESIKTSGYRPWRHHQNQITGTFLFDDQGNRRFVVMQGNHRVAVLATLGWSNIPIRIQPKICTTKVFLSDKNRWQYWNESSEKQRLMLSIFSSFFGEYGQHIRKRLFPAQI